jgi:predicted Zn-dependent protease
LYQAGFDPRAMVSFFNRLQKAIRIYETNAPSYLRTHPLTYERIADIENRVQNFPYKQVPDSLDFQLIRAKLRVTETPAKELLAYFEDNLAEKKYSNEAAQRYGLVATLIKLKEFNRAEKELTVLRNMHIAHPMIETLNAQLKIATGQNKAALEVYRRALQTYPDNRSLMYGYADTLMRDQQTDKAVKFLSDKLPFFSNDAKIYQLQSQAYASLSKNLLHHQAQAEFYAHSDNLPAAIEQLQIAQKSKDGNFYQISAVEARLKELQAINNEDIRNK